MMEIDIRHMVPAFLLADKNGYAMAKTVEKALQIFCDCLQTGLDTVLDIEKMPEWRLDEMAWEWNVLWYDQTAEVSVKREVIKNVWAVYRQLGTKTAVENVIQSYFGDGRLEEWFEYDGEPYRFRVHSTNPAVREEKLGEFLYVLEQTKRLSAILDGIDIEIGSDFELGFGFALHEYGTDTYYFGV